MNSENFSGVASDSINRSNPVNPVSNNGGAAVAENGGAPRTAGPGTNESNEGAVGDRGYNFPNSRRVYIGGELRPDISVAGFVMSSEAETSPTICSIL